MRTSRPRSLRPRPASPRRLPRLAVLLAAATVGLAAFAAADGKAAEQTLDDLKKEAPKVFLDTASGRLDLNYVREEITFVNYVRDRMEADVHVLITRQPTGGGGSEYTLGFIGLKSATALQNTLKFYTDRTMTPDEIRRGLVQVLKLGLAPYVARTPMARGVNLQLLGKVKATSVVDRWNLWVFNVSGRARLNGEEARKYDSYSLSGAVNRVSPGAKFRLGYYETYDRSKFDYEDTKLTSSARSRTLDGMYVVSLNGHWSAGAVFNFGFSTYSNLAFAAMVQPAVEYDIFPYSVSTRRQLRILYKLGYVYDRYLETTILGRMSDRLWNQSLSATLEMTEPWGTSSVSLEGSSYIPKTRYNRVVLSGDLNLRMLKGLALTLSARYSAVKDQISLRLSEVSLEDLLLRRAELASAYRYYLSVGFFALGGTVPARPYDGFLRGAPLAGLRTMLMDRRVGRRFRPGPGTHVLGEMKIRFSPPRPSPAPSASPSRPCSSRSAGRRTR